jgi:hypothetical protein
MLAARLLSVSDEEEPPVFDSSFHDLRELWIVLEKFLPLRHQYAPVHRDEKPQQPRAIVEHFKVVSLDCLECFFAEGLFGHGKASLTNPTKQLFL